MTFLVNTLVLYRASIFASIASKLFAFIPSFQLCDFLFNKEKENMLEVNDQLE